MICSRYHRLLNRKICGFILMEYLVILDDDRRQLVVGMDQADSLTFDCHKWLHCQYDAGCVLVRDVSHLESTFSIKSSQAYLNPSERG